VTSAFSARVAPGRQRYWDWRAAGNFILGGAGAGLILYMAVAGERWLALPGAALIGGGLLGVWLEIGRPRRALNAFRRPATSWMSREATVAPPLLASALAAAWLARPWLPWLAAALAVTYLHCQARMLNAARGIPAWRGPRIVPLLMATGLAEGAGLGVLATVWGQTAPRAWPTLLLALFLLARTIGFWGYRRGLTASGAHVRVLRDSMRFGLVLSALDALALALLILGTTGVRSAPLVLASALIAAGSGGWLKYTLVIRWSYQQPFTVPVSVERGGTLSPGTFPH
jgi:phenylacetyl-CoA:acceptor oxidoreductase subunit 2